MSSGLILDCADLIAPHISIIFNSSLANGIFPDYRKSARVTPLFKQDDRRDIDNYRPISVISITGKVFKEFSTINSLPIYRIIIFCLSTNLNSVRFI